MTRANDLATWLQTNLPVSDVTFNTSESYEPNAPVAVCAYTGDLGSAVFDGTSRVETYEVQLLVPRVGYQQADILTAVSQVEQALILASVDFVKRVNARWDHFQTRLLQADRGNGRVAYEIRLTVTGV